MQADVYTLETTYRIQISDGGAAWYDHDQTEYTDAADVHQRASEMYGGLKPDEYRLIQITRTVIEN